MGLFNNTDKKNQPLYAVIPLPLGKELQESPEMIVPKAQCFKYQEDAAEKAEKLSKTGIILGFPRAVVVEIMITKSDYQSLNLTNLSEAGQVQPSAKGTLKAKIGQTDMVFEKGKQIDLPSKPEP